MAINKRINAKNSQISVKKTKVNRNDRYDLDALKARLLDDETALDVFALAGVPSELIEHARQTGRERAAGAPCPLCGGRDRFKLVRPKDGAGGWLAFCRQCDAGGRSYSPIDFYMTARGLNLNAAVRKIVDALDGSNANAMRMTKNDVVIQSAPPIRQTAPVSITAKPSARITATTAPETSKKGLRVVPETEARQETRDYIYTDENGAPVFNARRFDFYDKTTGERVAIIDRNGNVKEKDFRTYIPDGASGWTPSNGLDRSTIPPYNLPKLKGPACQYVYIVEGERAAERLERALAGYDGERVATTTGATSNAGHWRQWAPRVLSEKGVFVLADHDAPGRKAAETIAEAAAPFAAENVQIIDFETRPDGTPAPAGYDVADYLDDLERVDPSAIASNYLDARAVPFTPSAFPLQRKRDAGNGLDAPPVDPDEELNRVAMAARLEREKDVEQEQLENELALYTRDFPLDAVPDCLSKHAQSYAERFNLPIASVIFTQLATIGAFLGSKITFYDPSIWPEECYSKIGVLGVAPSGGYKTPIYRQCTRPLREIDEEKKRRYQEALKAAKQKRAEIKEAKGELKRLVEKIKRRRGDNSPQAKAEVDTFRNRIRTLEGIIDAEGSQEASDPSRIPKFLVRGTPEKITNIIALNLRDGHKNGVLTGDDEGIRVLNVCGGVDKALERFFKYTALLDGKSDDHETVTTESAGDYDVPGEKFAGVLFFIQPGPFARLIRKKDLIDQGFLNRFIKVFIPYSEQDENLYEVKYYQLYKNVFNWALKANAQKFSLSKDARDVFFQWKRQNKRQQNDAHNRNDEEGTAFLGKAQILFISFLLSIHVCDFIDGRRNAAMVDDAGTPAPTTEIDAETVGRVVKLVDAAIDYTETCNRYLDLCIKRLHFPQFLKIH